MFQASFNNRPAWSANAVGKALQIASDLTTKVEAFEQVLVMTIKEAFSGKYAHRGRNLTEKTFNGARLASQRISSLNEREMRDPGQ